MIQFDLNISEKTGLKLNYHLESKHPSNHPVQRNLSTPPTPPVLRQFDNMILTPDGHLKLLDFGTGDQEWKTFLGEKVEELPPPWSWENGINMFFLGGKFLFEGWVVV